MARRIVVLALILIALVGLVSADKDASPKSSQEGSKSATAAPGNDDDDNAIGNTDDAGALTHNSTGAGDADDDAVEGPIGSEGDVAKIASASAQPPSNGATTLGCVSAVAGAAAVAGCFVF